MGDVGAFTQWCIPKGVRHRPGFGSELRDASRAADISLLVRTLNPRTIMSDQTPDIDDESHVPANALPSRPRMAVAGYARLYRELNLLPDVPIAEEARDNLATNDAQHQLNGDTAATTFGFTGHYDNHAAPDEEGVLRPKHDAMQSLLRNLLPHDLPAGDKDVLILIAAYHGDIDRYARLRRPVHVSINEDCCVRRDIHHNTGFARWMLHDQPSKHYIQAINAPIWYPTRAAAETYVELARRRPYIRPAVARALIDYPTGCEEKMDWDFGFSPAALMGALRAGKDGARGRGAAGAGGAVEGAVGCHAELGPRY
ncbi:hypothetical protein GGTG_07184 [Gaeumannomyces tritici R3-111a-1]|uniref:Uncharacterized protein n=1 Tax=Gaeumannomyces tritici (strain R3-111a-1) TaxID=644352 RepID=J3P0Y8_GAET3|nr:hypothetical protein GGTG_07184 [Gaeumannomyces tritici R3-111a-1]EJT77272.1 hypothetical protein GGTG_07184 [Gaeumannomyces tritici R3-111a-1]